MVPMKALLLGGGLGTFSDSSGLPDRLRPTRPGELVTGRLDIAFDDIAVEPDHHVRDLLAVRSRLFLIVLAAG
jgi:hypothetical protein